MDNGRMDIARTFNQMAIISLVISTLQGPLYRVPEMSETIKSARLYFNSMNHFELLTNWNDVNQENPQRIYKVSLRGR